MTTVKVPKIRFSINQYPLSKTPNGDASPPPTFWRHAYRGRLHKTFCITLVFRLCLGTQSWDNKCDEIPLGNSITPVPPSVFQHTQIKQQAWFNSRGELRHSCSSSVSWHKERDAILLGELHRFCFVRLPWHVHIRQQAWCISRKAIASLLCFVCALARKPETTSVM